MRAKNIISIGVNENVYTGCVSKSAALLAISETTKPASWPVWLLRDLVGLQLVWIVPALGVAVECARLVYRLFKGLVALPDDAPAKPVALLVLGGCVVTTASILIGLAGPLVRIPLVIVGRLALVRIHRENVTDAAASESANEPEHERNARLDRLATSLRSGESADRRQLGEPLASVPVQPELPPPDSVLTDGEHPDHVDEVLLAMGLKFGEAATSPLRGQMIQAQAAFRERFRDEVRFIPHASEGIIEVVLVDRETGRWVSLQRLS